ncbi:MAG TPA: hydrophobe/amphiphile efflux-1 family RND transporter, partial [Planctomycetes bacterium]|nr:hydrophobe/amphiphile efflux-1 family RND transporter [Planctomycetota bacterium]
MFSRFIHRPVLAIVVSVTLVFLGLLAIRALPNSQFPKIAPPRVIVAIAYPGASADVLVRSTLIPIERSINGVPGMRYLISDSTSAGEATIQVIFELGTDPNAAVVNVKNRVDRVLNRLPPLVQREGVIVQRVQPSMLMYVNLYSKDKEANQKFVYNYANVYLLPELKRIRGMGRARILGQRQYAMRVWLKPDRMRAYNVSTEEVLKAIDEQSVIGRPGRTGRSSGKKAQSLEYVLVYRGRFNKPEEYEDIIIRAYAEGDYLRLKDIASVDLESEFYDIYSNLDGHPSAAIVLKQSYGSNASKVIESVKAKLEELRPGFPPGMEYKISYDVSNFLDASTEQVLHTLVEAFVLVACVVFVFLGDWRSTLIPTLAVPVSLIGAFVFMNLFGFTINLITLFALVLAIGIVVDDAIVVVEAVHAKMEAEHVSPYRAVKEVLGEISGAIIAITVMMSAVFVPVAFMTGPVGVFYRQFSVTMATSIILSGVVALTLTPVLCAMILRAHDEGKRTILQRIFLDPFNRAFEAFTGVYAAILERIAHRRLLTFALLAGVMFGVYKLNEQLPAGFIPAEDQGIVYAIVQTPPGATLERTNAVSRRLQAIAEEIPEIESVSSLAGYEILTEGRGSNAGTCLINLRHWSERHKDVNEVVEELEERSKNIGAVIEFFQPPAVPGYGAAGGFALRLLDKTNTTNYRDFDKINKDFMAALRQRKELTGLFTFFAANYPQYELIIDNKLAMQKGVSVGKALENLGILIGSTYEQGFIRFGRFFKVYTQAAPEYRALPSDILELYVKNEAGEMVPYSAFMKLKKTQGPNEITRYNLYTSSAIRGTPAKGYTSDEAIKAVQEVAAQTLPRGYDIAWEGLSFDEARRGNEALWIFLEVLLFVYLVLAAQYESFLLPFAVLLPLPAGVFGSFFLLQKMGLANDIYAQVGLVMLVGLLGKNAVLIVEVAVQSHRHGMPIREAAIHGARTRFRPILMTSFAFVAGLIPLVRAHGPGAVGNRTIGASAMGGMLAGTLFGVLIVPGLYYIFASLSGGRKLIRDEEDSPLSEGHDEVVAAEVVSGPVADLEPAPVAGPGPEHVPEESEAEAEEADSDSDSEGTETEETEET